MLISGQMIIAQRLIDLLFVAAAVVISMVLHELAHGYVALWNGDPTAKVNGRLTLNPLAHFDLIGFIMLMTVGFGYARPVPVNPYNFKHQKRGIFTVAIAGVSVNFVLAFISCGLWYFMFFLANAFPNVGMVFQGFATFFQYMVQINLSLIFFNLLPIYPLDGFRIVEAFTRFTNPYTKFMRDYGSYILIALIGLGIIVDLFHLPYFIDILGTYIGSGVSGIRWLFSQFWQLIF